MARRWTKAISALCAAILIVPAAAQRSPERITLTPASRDGVVLFTVETVPAEVMIRLQRAGQSGFGSRVYDIPVAMGVGDVRYVGRTLRPGRYRIDSIWQQNRWGLVFARDTVEFDVTAGGVTYLGAMNNRALLMRLQEQTIAAGRTYSSAPGSGFSSTTHGMRPEFSGRTPTGLAAATEFATRVMSAGAGRVILGELIPASSAER